MLWLAGDVKEPTRLSQRVGHEVPGVVVWPLLLSEGWGGKCSEILATIKLLYNPRVNKVFTFTFTSYFKMNRTFLPFLLRIPFIITRGTGVIKLSTIFVEERLGLMHKRPSYRPTGTHPSPRSVLEWRSANTSTSLSSTSRPTLCTH